MLAAAGRKLDVRLEAVDANGLLPLRATDKVFTAAHHFRRFLHRELPEHFDAFPTADPLARHGSRERPEIPSEIRNRWPEADLDLLAKGPVDRALPMVGGAVGPTETVGGERAARRKLGAFVDRLLAEYGEQRNDPDSDGTSGLSAYLHFGHISAHEVVDAVFRSEGWTPGDIEPGASGKRSGWWGVSASAESFLDELVTWREVGFNAAAHQPGYERYESLPDWARRTLSDHEGDHREHVYSLEEFESAATHDALWNAAQRQLVREGRIHGYLRMLWGKKILEWTLSAREALEVMVELNNKYALDGRDPNSYSGIMWVLGRYDRPWGPERPIFGKIRYMTSANTARKVGVAEYLKRYAD
jgi:deoxyribodipyrimidine photo-lyase